MLGRLALENGPGLTEGAAARRRSLALLAILAAAGEQGVPRDKLLLYLWPESNTRRARNSLHQTIYAIRRQLGQDTVLIGIPNVQLNPAFFSTDLWDFEAALERGATDEAIGRYEGPFLDGFSIPDLPEFDHWMEEERARIARQYADALEASAARASQQGHHRLAVERWQALVRLDPLSARPALGLMRAFAAAGNRASALEHAREYEARIRQELGTTPDPSVAALAEQLRVPRMPPRERDAGRPPAPPASVEPEPVPAGPVSPLMAAADRAPAPPPVAEPAAGMAPRRGVAAWILKAAIILLVLLDASALGYWWWSRRAARQPTVPGLVAVFPFSVEGSPDVRYLGTGLVDLLTTNLEGAGETRSVDPRALLGRLSQRGAPVHTPAEARDEAARFGAGLYLLGNVVESGGRLRLQAALYDRRDTDEPVARAAVEGPASDLFSLVDRLTTQILAGGRQEPHERLARVAAATTGALDALKAYLAGERELRAGRYVQAMDAFQQAVAVDTGFALAFYRLSIAAEWVGQDSVAQQAALAAARFDGRLSEHDRLLVRALVGRRAGDPVEAERLYRQVVDDYPDDVEAWLQLGQLLFQSNPLRGRSATEARPAFERVVALDPENEEALVHLARIASIEGRRSDMQSLMRRLLALQPATEVLETRAFRAFALGDRDAWKRVTREMLKDPPKVPPVTALQVAIYLDDLDGAERFARLLRDPQYSDDVRGMAYRLLARVAVARGQWSPARADLDTASQFDSTAALELRSLLAALPFVQLPRSELLEIRRQVEQWPAALERAGESSHSAGHRGLHPYVRLYRLGLLDVQLGDTNDAVRQAQALDRAADSARGLKADALHTFAQSLKARTLDRGGRFAEALAQLDQADWQHVESVFEAEALDRYYRADLLFEMGRDVDALAWYRTIAERATYELVYVAPARWREGQIYQRQGDTAKAVASYRAVARLWRDAEPEFRPVLSDAQQRLRALTKSNAESGAGGTRPPGASSISLAR